MSIGQTDVLACAQVESDAKAFGKVLNRNWEGGLLVARSVEHGTAGRPAKIGKDLPITEGKASARQFAEWAGVSHPTVTAYLEAWNRAASAGLVPDAADLSPGDHVNIEELPAWDTYYRKGGAHVGNNSGENEWYTPPEYIEAAMKVMGGIDLDPASHAEANKIVKAKKFFSAKDDGLAQEWSGRVWMNPPYAQPLIDHFCSKLAESFDAGSITAACVLINNATETGWFQKIATPASAICFPRGRVKFWHPERESAPLQGQAVVYLGADAKKFCEAFRDFGFTAKK